MYSPVFYSVGKGKKVQLSANETEAAQCVGGALPKSRAVNTTSTWYLFGNNPLSSEAKDTVRLGFCPYSYTSGQRQYETPSVQVDRDGRDTEPKVPKNRKRTFSQGRG